MNALITGVDSRSDEELAVLARENHEDAFAELVSRCSGMLKSLSSKYCQGDFEADDLAQEGLLGLLAAVKTYRPSDAVLFRTYAYTCMRNRMISALRRRHGEQAVPLKKEDEPSAVSDGDDPAMMLVRQEEARQLQQRLQRDLTALEYRVLMAHLGGYAYREIAKQLAVSEKTVDNALQRVRRKLASAL